jgi:hypothetical protein
MNHKDIGLKKGEKPAILTKSLPYLFEWDKGISKRIYVTIGGKTGLGGCGFIKYLIVQLIALFC